MHGVETIIENGVLRTEGHGMTCIATMPAAAHVPSQETIAAMADLVIANDGMVPGE
jgi:hypothetical protein